MVTRLDSSEQSVLASKTSTMNHPMVFRKATETEGMAWQKEQALFYETLSAVPLEVSAKFLLLLALLYFT